MATHEDTTAVPPLPSVYDLGRIHRALYDEINRTDVARTAAKDGSDAYKDFNAECEQLTSEAHAVDDLILACPIETLADAATIAVHLHSMIILCDTSVEASDVRVMAAAAARLGVALAREATIDLDLLGSGGSKSMMLRQAGLSAGVGVVS